MRKINKICPICKKQFTVPFCHQDRYKTCGHKCGGIYRHKPSIINKCQNCSIKFTSKKYKRHKQNYCSRKCFNEHSRTGQHKDCPICKKTFYIPKNLINKIKHCSKKCSQKHFVKKEMPGSYRQNAWKTYEKKCHDCGITDERILVIHHIDGNRKNGKIENLIPVCHNCHCIRHIKLSGNHRLPSYRGED